MKYAIVTPSYAPDFERCRLLCESIDRYFMGDYHHYLLVEARDRRLFDSLRADNRTIQTINDYLPRWLIRLPGARRWWLSLRTPPVRNWIMQQLIKLSSGQMVDEDVLVFVDSDVAFIRPLTLDRFERDGRTRLYRVVNGAHQAPHTYWHKAAAELLGLPSTDYFGASYIGHPTIWRKDVLFQMLERIEMVNGCSWQAATCRRWQFSEYILYGVFAEHVLGDRANHFYCADQICHNSWDYSIATDEELQRFFNALAPTHLAVMVSSKQSLPVSRYRRQYEAIRATHVDGQDSGGLSESAGEPPIWAERGGAARGLDSTWNDSHSN